MKISKKKIIIICSIIIVIAAIIPVSYVIYKNIEKKEYTSYFNQGNKFMESDDLKNAKIKYDNAMNYENTPDIKNKIEVCKELINSKDKYNTAISNFNSKDYINAVSNFNAVSVSDKKRYTDAQNKKKECIKNIIDNNIKKAKDCASEKLYDNAIGCLAIAAGYDKNNQEIINLKKQFEDAQKKEYEEDEKEEEEKKRTDAISNMKKPETGTGNIGISILSYKYTDTVDTGYGNYYYQKDKNVKFLWIDIGVVNVGTINGYVNPNNFTLSLPTGYTVNYDYKSTFSLNNYLNSTTLNPNGTTSGWLIFDVTKESEYTLHFNGLDGSVDKRIIIQ